MNSKSWKNITFSMVLCGLSSVSGFAQSFDSSGTSGVKGPYFVRQIFTANADFNTSAIGRAASLTGIMTFDGAGNYAFSGQLTDTSSGQSAASYTVSGIYAVSASGLVQITNPIDTTDVVYGGVGAVGPSAIVGSSTEGVNNDVFIAVPAGSGATNSTLTGTYNAGFIDFLQGNASQVRDGYLNLTSGGSGSFGTVSVSGVMANQSSTLTTQSLAGVTYSVASGNGAGTITFPTASTPLTTLVSGQKTLYLSSDGNILIGGNPAGFDLLVAIKASSGAISNSSFQGTYFTAALENDASQLASGDNSIDSFYGSTLGLGEGDAILHERLVYFNSLPFDFSGYEPAAFSNGATYNDGFFQNMLGLNGQALLQVGVTSYYSLTVNLQAKTQTGSGVFINPLGVLNAASYAPITNSVTGGEFISIFGSGMASGVFAPASLPLPTTSTNNVQVKVNGILAPLSYVSATQINILVPYAVSSANYATFQVFNNGVASNQVTLYSNFSAPGVFTGTPSGIGTAAVLHADFSPVTQSSPAKTNETVLVYLTGLGSVTPSVGDGAAAPGGANLSLVDESIGVDIYDQNGNDVNATSIPFAGLAPGFAGLYQVNFVVPSGLASGVASLDIGTQDAYTTESQIYLGAGSTANAKKPARSARPARRMKAQTRVPNTHRAAIRNAAQ